MAKFRAIYDTDYTVPQQGYSFMHCGKCLEEWKKLSDISPKEYARQQISMTAKGWQVWCNRHDCNIALITVEPKEDEDGEA